MNDEIKEILWIIKSCKQDYDKQKNGMHTFDYGELYLLYNYITNLQQEIEKLNEDKRGMLVQLYKANDEKDKIKQENERLKEKLGIRRKICLEAVKREQDYKSRCEKASEYNNQIIKDTKDFYRPTTDIIYSGDALIEIATNNINILQNGSENDE